MQLPPHLSFLAQPVALWMANADDHGVPALTRCAGVVVLDQRMLTVFVPEALGREFLANLREAAPITLSATDVPTYQSYQYKGIFRGLRECTEQEIALQRAALDDFTCLLESLGFSKESFFKSYFHQPSFAVLCEVTEVFDQTPRKGTGVSISKAA